MPATESPLAVFRHAYFAPIDQYLAWHDGYEADFACLAALTPTGQAEAAAELLAALRAGTADARAIMGLGYLRYAEALPLLHDYLRRSAYSMYTLEAIAQISPAGLYKPLVVKALSPKVDWTQLIDVLTGLREYFTLPQLGAGIAARIFVLLVHPEYLARYHALSTLRRLYGLQTAATQRQPQSTEDLRADELFGLLTTDKRPADYRKAQQLLLTKLDAALLREFPLG
ncbi:MAG: hypothetical protein ACRYFX_10470 [Janthinobacterium lividum]